MSAFIVALVLICAPVVYPCPPASALLPCTCYMDSADNAQISCSNLDNEVDLKNAMTALIGKKNIYSIDIKDSVLNFLPQDIFKGVQFVELLLESSSFMDLTDTDVAFVGLENYLELFYIRDCDLMNEWDWSKLKNHKALAHIDIVGGDMQSVGEEISKLGHLNITNISFERNAISFVYEKAFASFQDLHGVILATNEIEIVKRSMFPKPAHGLMLIDLSFNRIQSLPDDLLTDMPALDYFMVRSNKLLTLGEKTFTPVWQQLKEFDAKINEIRCDCRLNWMLDLKFPEETIATCAEPPALKNRELQSLSSKDLWCRR